MKPANTAKYKLKFIQNLKKKRNKKKIRKIKRKLSKNKSGV